MAASNALLADDLDTATELSSPAITQIHVILANDLQSLAQWPTPRGRQKWIDEEPDNESWTPTTEAGGVWTPIAKDNETWNEVA